MVWKPKEKELTPQQAIDLTKRELAPRWVDSPPLVAMLKSPQTQQYGIYPLDPFFPTRAWVFIFIDPFSFSAESYYWFIREWHTRYSIMGLDFLAVFSSEIPIQGGLKGKSPLSKKGSGIIPLVHDADQGFAHALEKKTKAYAVLLSQGKTHFKVESQKTDAHWFQEVEKEIQRFLRSDHNPGLPLLSVIKTHQSISHETRQWFFSGAQPLPKEIEINQPYQLEADHLLIHQAKTTITFKTNDSHIAFVARVAQVDPQPTRVIVEMDRKPVFDSVSGKDIAFDESGYSYVSVSDVGFYQITKGGTEHKERSVSLHFPHADKMPVKIYKISLGSI